MEVRKRIGYLPESIPLYGEMRVEEYLDYRAKLKELCPNGIDLFFDNVGGTVLDEVLARINLRARIVLCGAISRYNDTGPVPGPANYFNLVSRRGRMEGFIVLDFASRFPEAIAALDGYPSTHDQPVLLFLRAQARVAKLRLYEFDVTSGKTRVAALPELPTVAEAGIAGYEAALWVSLVVPSGTSPRIIARLNREMNDVLESSDGTEALIAQGMAPEPGPPEALTERIRGDIEKWRGVAAKAGIRYE